MTEPGEDPRKDHGSGRPSGFAWSLLLVLFGFMAGLALGFWLFGVLGWW